MVRLLVSPVCAVRECFDSLGNNVLGDAGAVLLFAALEVNNTIKELKYDLV